MLSDKARAYIERLGGKVRVREALIPVSLASPSPNPMVAELLELRVFIPPIEKSEGFRTL